MSTLPEPNLNASAAADWLLVSMKQAGVLLSISETEVKREIARGRLGSVKRGRRRAIRRHDLDAYVASLGERT